MDQIVGGCQGGPLDHAALGDGQGGVEHVEAAVVRGDAHRPDLVVVARPRVAGAECGREGLPGEPIGAEPVLDDIVVRERQVKEVEVVAVGQNFDVADIGEADTTGRVHGSSPFD